MLKFNSLMLLKSTVSLTIDNTLWYLFIERIDSDSSLDSNFKIVLVQKTVAINAN